MMATSRKIPEDEPGEIEALLPWYAAGTLDAREARRVEAALADDPRLVRQYAAIQDEYAETIHLNESLGAPSSDAMQKLFAAIDAEPARAYSNSPRLSTRISGFFASLSPRTLAWSASLGALALLLQAGVIGTVLMQQQETSFETASYQPAPRTMTRSLAPGNDVVLFVRFKPDARVSDITALLGSYHASVVGGSGDMFRLQFAGKASADAAAVLSDLQKEKIVAMAVPAQ
jgi:anti-sigma factor RsiW